MDLSLHKMFTNYTKNYHNYHFVKNKKYVLNIHCLPTYVPSTLESVFKYVHFHWVTDMHETTMK